MADEREWDGRDTLIAFLLFPLMVAWVGFVLAKLWVWFIVPATGLEPIGVVNAAGLTFVASLLRGHSTTKLTKGPIEIATTRVLYVAIILGIGAITHAFM